MQQTNTNMIIAENEKWFNFWLIYPKVSTIFFAFASFILGIIFAAADDAIFILIFWGGGAVFCVLNYFFLKLVMSYKILHIYYLKKISLNNGNVAAQPSVASKPDELPKI